jgi:hypothetical protein
VAHFPSTFGTDEVMSIARQSGDRIKPLLALYKRQLKSVAEFVGKFDMHGKRDQKTYSLFFASNAPKGFEKMKEAMWSVDQGEGGKFSDFEPSAVMQQNLFGSSELWSEIITRFRGKRVLMAELEQFVIEETDYLPKHARSLSEGEEERGSITVEAAPGYKRRKGTFKADKVHIVFRQ